MSSRAFFFLPMRLVGDALLPIRLDTASARFLNSSALVMATHRYGSRVRPPGNSAVERRGIGREAAGSRPCPLVGAYSRGSSTNPTEPRPRLCQTAHK